MLRDEAQSAMGTRGGVQLIFWGVGFPKEGVQIGGRGPCRKKSSSVGPIGERFACWCLSLPSHLELWMLFASVRTSQSFFMSTLLPGYHTPSPHARHLPGTTPPVIIPGLDILFHPQRNKSILFPMLPLGVKTHTLTDTWMAPCNGQSSSPALIHQHLECRKDMSATILQKKKQGPGKRKDFLKITSPVNDIPSVCSRLLLGTKT